MPYYKSKAVLEIRQNPLDVHINQQELENRFSNTVLIGNWFEERFSKSNDEKNAITPGIYGKSNCNKETTLYKRDFIAPISKESQQDFKDFIKWKQQGFRNRLNGEISNIKLWDGDQYERNATTFKDIMYRLKPLENCKWGEYDLLKNQRKADDFMRSYGNSTETGLRKWRACEEWHEQNIPIDVSHYRNQFKKPHMEPRQCPFKATPRKTII